MENEIRLDDLPPTYQQIAMVIGIENVVKLGRELGGEQFYLPKLDVCLAFGYVRSSKNTDVK
ncbi:hypothetical protein FBQ80_13695 [Candidatus Brocadia sp. AMX2]|uniref:hypothetical protein n=1 Tax=Candidatus Brocadia sp. AMX2 TaxID=2293635 RepID=UPI0025556C43|nr:hypothetical protein [Candidatus Brocadia sp. AMX2]MDL1936608.1 hypothetical protein [Candidatus Brocadia sp. AMX2]